MANNLRKSLVLAGHTDIAIYALKEDPIEHFVGKGDYKTACFFKPYVIREALNDTPKDIIWMDVDCIVKSNLEDILGDADVAVTLRRGSGLRDVYDGYINAGVMAFRNNQAASNFIKAWIAKIPGSRADQDAANKVLLDGGLIEAKYDEVIGAGGAKVMVRSCDEYNFFYFPESNNARIYHIKGSLREEFYGKCVTEVLGGK